MKKSVRIHLLVITTVVAIFVFAGIWYLRPGVPNELLEQARARQLQPLLEIEAPIRKPVVEAVTQSPVDKKALAEELLPSLTEEVARSLEGPLYEKLKKEFASDDAFVALVSAKLEKTLNLGAQPATVASTPAIPQALQASFTQQVEALRKELLATLGEGQSSFFFNVEGMLDARLDRFEDDIKAEMEAYVPQLVDRMIPTLVEMLVKELDANKETYLPYLAQELQPHLADSLTEEELVLLYTSYRDQIVVDLVPAILTAMEEPARREVAEMVKNLTSPVAPVPVPPQVVTSVVKVAPVVEPKPAPVVEPKVAPVVEPKPAPVVEPKVAPVVEPKVVPTSPEVVAEPMDEAPKKPAVPKKPSIATPTSVVQTVEAPKKPAVPKALSLATPTSGVQKIEPVLIAPVFSTDGVEVFVDPLTYEQKRTEIRTKAIQDVLDRIYAL